MDSITSASFVEWLTVGAIGLVGGAVLAYLKFHFAKKLKEMEWEHKEEEQVEQELVDDTRKETRAVLARVEQESGRAITELSSGDIMKVSVGAGVGVTILWLILKFVESRGSAKIIEDLLNPK